MKSIKPGRGPSAMGGVASVIAVIFGIFWTGIAAKSGAPFIFPLFGIFFIGLGIAQAVIHFRNAAGKNRFSAFDITDSAEEPDPFNEMFGTSVQDETANAQDSRAATTSGTTAFCPYCGAPANADFTFCRKCGKALPK